VGAASFVLPSSVLLGSFLPSPSLWRETEGAFDQREKGAALRVPAFERFDAGGEQFLRGAILAGNGAANAAEALLAGGELLLDTVL